MTAPVFSVNDYVRAMQALLPRGPAWPRDDGAIPTETLRGLAPIYYRINQSAVQLLVDAFPATANAMLPEWQATLGLTDTGDTLAQQQAQVVAALTAVGGQSKAYFIALAARLGFQISISYYRAARVTDTVNSPIYGSVWAFAWQVTGITVADYTRLQAIFEKFKPAHTAIIWNVPSGALLSEDGSSLLTTESGDWVAVE